MDSEEQAREARQLLGTAGPAFLRRARRVEDAWNQLTTTVTLERVKMMEMVELRVGMLHALAGDWQRLAEMLPDVPIEDARVIHRQCQPRLRASLEATRSVRVLAGAWEELRASVERFNRRWQEWLAGVDLAPLNRVRDEYNRHYVLEKECAVGSAQVARQGFCPLLPLRFADLLAQFPLLPTLDLLRASGSSRQTEAEACDSVVSQFESTHLAPRDESASRGAR